MSVLHFDGIAMHEEGRALEPRGERRFHCLGALQLESVRRRTFTNWTVTFIDPDMLARAGFYYLRTKDHVQCVFCQGIVGFWDEGDQPDLEHRKHFPNCPFVTGVATGNVPANDPLGTDEGRLYSLLDHYNDFKVGNTRPSLPSTYQTDSTLVAEGRQQAFPQFNTSISRLKTFSRWPEEVGVNPEQLAEAGFFYTGHSDWVQCFHCGGGLFSWRRGDNPFVDHDHHYPFCTFIRIMWKGDAGNASSCPPNATRQQTTLSIQEAELLLHHPIAKRLVTMGLSQTSVREALKLRLEARGVLCRTVTDALELVFDYEEKQRREDLKNKRHDGLRLPNVMSSETPSGTANQVELQQHFLPPTPPPEEFLETPECRYARLLEEVKGLQQEVASEEQRQSCRVCKQQRVEVVLQPCSHFHLCASCVRLTDSCVTCGSQVRGTLMPIVG